MARWFPEFFDRYGALTVFDLLTDYLKSGRISLDKNRISQRVAYHDPCNYGRKSEELFGHGYYEEPRWVLDQFVSDWVDLFPFLVGRYLCGLHLMSLSFLQRGIRLIEVASCCSGSLGR